MRRSIEVMVLAAVLLGISTAETPAYVTGEAGINRAFQFRLGGMFPAGESELWEGNEELFTLDVSDFDGAVVGLTYLNSVNNSLEMGLNVDFFGETVRSQYQLNCTPDLTCQDENGLPILHDTDFSIVPLTFDVRVIPGGRYRIRGSRHVLKPVFYVGAGLGMSLWEYEEVGEFIDFFADPAEIVPGRFKDSGAAFEFHVLAGVELPVGVRSNLLLEARRGWADDDLGDDFAGLGEIDLGGTSIYGGVSVRF